MNIYTHAYTYICMYQAYLVIIALALLFLTMQRLKAERGLAPFLCTLNWVMSVCLKGIGFERLQETGFCGWALPFWDIVFFTFVDL